METRETAQLQATLSETEMVCRERIACAEFVAKEFMRQKACWAGLVGRWAVLYTYRQSTTSYSVFRGHDYTVLAGLDNNGDLSLQQHGLASLSST